MEYATAIPVAVTNLKDPGKGLKRMGPPSTIVLPAKKGPAAPGPAAAQAAAAAAAAAAAGGARNIIFAGNTLPQGAIPVQVMTVY